MVAATVLTLVFVPVFYAMIERWRERGAEHRPEPASDEHGQGPLAEAAE